MKSPRSINPSPQKIDVFRSLLLEWGENHFSSYPWRYANNEWHALVAEIMLQRTRADQVVPVYNDFVQKYKTPKDYAAETNSKVFDQLGLKWREETLKMLSHQLSGKSVPKNKNELLELNGVGDYIASAYRSFYLNYRDVIIDSNIVRLYGRIFGFETNPETRRKRWFINLAETITPQHNFKAFNYALLDFTRSICRPAPLCSECPLNHICEYYQGENNDLY